MSNKTLYKDFKDKEISAQQERVMMFIAEWVRTKKTPVPQKEIMLAMKEQGMTVDAIKWALNILLAKHYVRKAWTEKQNTTAYVQLRGV